jgi:hypothetical protein
MPASVVTWTRFHRHPDACSDLLVALQNAPKNAEVNVDGIFSANKPESADASNWLHA